MRDIVRHMSNVIARAEREVFLATNYWQNSVAAKYITNAIRELDRRAGARGTRIVLKILYDRGSPRQLYEPHYIVSEKEFTGEKVNLPHPSEIPNIDMEVMNFHTPLMGTFHAKYVVVDRRVALLQSNNIQDNDNLEMLVHLEGPIVDSLYDMALISWHKRLNPPLPSHKSPAAQGGLTVPNGLTNGTVDGGGEGNGISNSVTEHCAQVSESLPEHTADEPHYDDDIAGEVARSQASLAPKPGETHLQAVTRLLNHTLNEGLPGDPNAPECPPGELMTPYIPHQSHTPYPMALVNRAPYGPPTHSSVSTPQNAAWLSALRHAKHTVYIVSPTLNASPLIPAILAACERGVDVHCYICLSYNDAVSPPPPCPFAYLTSLPTITNHPMSVCVQQGELLPRQGGHNEKVSSHLHISLSPAARSRLHYHWYVKLAWLLPLYGCNMLQRHTLCPRDSRCPILGRK
jgi:phosphatidylserine/phosphatidylglycerophosphate/cardiolipin synthase-like enzyme